MAPGVENRSLLDIVATRGTLNLDELRRLGDDLARVLSATDARSGPHGTISPATVVLAATGVEVIAAPTLTEVAGYVAPEVASGTSADAAADVFALGAVLVYAATGVGPFGAGTPLQLLNRALTSEPDLGAVPRQLRQVVADCLARDPRQRPSAADLVARLGISPPPTESSATSADFVTPAVRSPCRFSEFIRRYSKTAASDRMSSRSSAPRKENDRRRLRRALHAGATRNALRLVVVSVLAVPVAVVHYWTTGDSSDESRDETPDTSRVALIATPDVNGLAITPDGQRLYVGHGRQAALSVIDTATNVVSALIDVPQKPNGLAVSADGASVYVASYDSLSVVATATNTTVDSSIVDHDAAPQSIVVSRDGARLYVADGLRATISVHDARTRNSIAVITVGGEKESTDAIALTPDDRHLFASADGQISMIDTATTGVTARATIDRGLTKSLSVDPLGRWVYAVSGYPSTLHVLDAATGSEVGAVDLNGTSAGLAVSPNGRYLYVATEPNSSAGGFGDIAVVDTTSRTVVGRIQSGIGAGHLVIAPDGRRLYASPMEFTGSSVAVIDVSRYA